MDLNTIKSIQPPKQSSKRDDAAGEWFEDASSDADWVENLSLVTISSLPNDSSMNTEELIEKNLQLTSQLKQSESRLEQIQSDNEKLRAQLALEKRKQVKSQKKLKYIQDNQEIFSRLKEAYLSMKYNETAGHNLTLIKENSSQTWGSILCESCITMADQRNSSLRNQEAIDGILGTINQIRGLVDKRERASALSEHKELKHVEIIKSLEGQNKILQELLKSKYVGMCPFELPEKLQSNYSAFMKKIIFKQEKRLREMLKYNTCRKYTLTPLNDNEKTFVDLIVSQFLRKPGKKSSTNIRCRSCDRKPKPESMMSFSWCAKLDGAAEKLEEGVSKDESREIDLVDKSETL